MKKLALIFYFTLFLAQVASAEVPDAKMQKSMTDAGFSEQQISLVQSMIVTTPPKELQAEYLTSKVYEGIAKHVPPDRIVLALEQVASRFEYGHVLAEELVQGEKQVNKVGETVTSGIAAGLTHQDIEKIAASLQSRSATVNRNDFYSLTEETMRTARDLSRQGVSSATTAEMVDLAVKSGFNASEMQTMRGSFNKQGVHGNIESLAKRYGNAIEQGVKAQELANHGRNGKKSGGGMHGNSDGSSNAGSSNGSDGSGESGGNGNGGGSSGSGGSGNSGGSGGNGNSGSGGRR